LLPAIRKIIFRAKVGNLSEALKDVRELKGGNFSDSEIAQNNDLLDLFFLPNSELLHLLNELS